MSEFEAYVRLGFSHITDPGGYDHLLFLIALCAVYHLRDWRKVLILVTAFTVGHSVTLALASFRILAVRTDVIEFLIPVTILVTALSNFSYQTSHSILDKTPSPYLRYVFALLFGFIHGLGFSGYLKSLLGVSAHIVPPLLAFNLGLELGQLLIVLLVLLFAWIVIEGFQVKKREWNLAVSGIVAGMALSLLIQSDFFK